MLITGMRDVKTRMSVIPAATTSMGEIMMRVHFPGFIMLFFLLFFEEWLIQYSSEESTAKTQCAREFHGISFFKEVPRSHVPQFF